MTKPSVSRRPERPERPSAVAHLRDLTPDPRNARKHGPRNVGVIADALREVGAARSIVIDEAGTILAGNATCEAAAEAGITKVQVVDADGETIVAVRRTGLTAAQKAKLALYDNRSAELAEGWETDVLRELAGEQDLSALFTPAELDTLLERAPEPEDIVQDTEPEITVARTKCPKCGYEWRP